MAKKDNDLRNQYAGQLATGFAHNIHPIPPRTTQQHKKLQETVDLCFRMADMMVLKANEDD